ncbi:hypothetical protein AY601_2970 [Pedobacter cryoconitis]|uniref:Uncharacterized protein n=1 Tax=Pedobacter cryoconitis TaxID=188932 RepID=A0A127VEW1_9SPHI|nr:hypothetical protein [Pedobacter cryoconitis]AMP99844.1 hypothetical protein AY601_2970 [Pedobacter cryoconitis]
MDKLSEKSYQLVVRGNVKMLTMMDSFSTTGTYVLSHYGKNAFKPDLQEYVLEERDVKLTEYYDPNTYQLIEYVNKLAYIYSRQHICINSGGVIKGLLNMPEIKTKWDKLKKELMQTNPIAAFEIIRHKERELANPPELIENLENTHFMHLFLYAFNYTADGVVYEQKKEERDRMGIGFLIPVNQTYTSETTDNGYSIHVESSLDEKGKIDKQMISKVTGQKEFDMKHYTKASFNYDHTGVLQSAEMKVFEQINNDYKSDLYLNLESI